MMTTLKMALCVSMACALFAQSRGPLPRGAALPAGTISGERTPELIPDDTAWEVFLQSVSVPTGATATAVASAMHKYKSAGLGSEDSEKVIKILHEFRDRAQALTAESRESGVSRQEVHGRYVSLLGATRLRLLAAMSEDGKAKLERHVQAIKSRITLVPSPMR